jgi:hypothetical protein
VDGVRWHSRAFATGIAQDFAPAHAHLNLVGGPPIVAAATALL